MGRGRCQLAGGHDKGKYPGMLSGQHPRHRYAAAHLSPFLTEMSARRRCRQTTHCFTDDSQAWHVHCSGNRENNDFFPPTARTPGGVYGPARQAGGTKR
jgi:hypothetical protein